MTVLVDQAIQEYVECCLSASDQNETDPKGTREPTRCPARTTSRTQAHFVTLWDSGI